MNELMKLSRDTQIVLGGTVLYIILSFLDWQALCLAGTCYPGINEWHGIGFFAALVAVLLLVWEIARMVGRQIEIGTYSPALVSVALAVALLVLTVITVLSHNEFRKWPQWVALIVSIGIAVVAVRRGREEGVEMPKMPASIGSSGGSGSSGGGSTTPASSTSTGDSTPAAAGGDEGAEHPPEAEPT